MFSAPLILPMGDRVQYIEKTNQSLIQLMFIRNLNAPLGKIIKLLKSSLCCWVGHPNVNTLDLNSIPVIIQALHNIDKSIKIDQRPKLKVITFNLCLLLVVLLCSPINVVQQARSTTSSYLSVSHSHLGKRNVPTPR